MNERIIYLPNGVNVEKFHVSEKRKFGEKDRYPGKVVIAQIARFTPKKGQHIFLNAISKLRRRAPDNCVFLFVGYVQDQSYFFALQQEAEKLGLGDRVSFFPNVTDEDLLSIYRDTDVLVLPSMAEGFPLSILEAWASKCSVIASEVGGIPYFVKNGQDSILVPPNDSDILSEKILDLVTDKELRKRLAMNGYERARREFSWDRVVDVISREYDSALG
jgi:glycosyltransferase involved in cell wall biosynthesis